MTLLYGMGENAPQDDDIRKYLNFNFNMLSFIGMEFNLNNDRPIKKSKFQQIIPIFVTNVMGLTLAAFEVNTVAFILREHNKEFSTTDICSELFSIILCICKVFKCKVAVTFYAFNTKNNVHMLLLMPLGFTYCDCSRKYTIPIRRSFNPLGNIQAAHT